MLDDLMEELRWKLHDLLLVGICGAYPMASKMRQNVPALSEIEVLFSFSPDEFYKHSSAQIRHSEFFSALWMEMQSQTEYWHKVVSLTVLIHEVTPIWVGLGVKAELTDWSARDVQLLQILGISRD